MNEIKIPKGAKIARWEVLDNILMFKFVNEPEFKDGNYVKLVSKISNETHHSIYKDSESFHCMITSFGVFFNSVIGWSCSSIELMSKYEQQEFNEALAKQGYRFNQAKKELEKLPKRAKKGEYFYNISRTFKVLKSTDNRDATSTNLYECGNYFTDKVTANIKLTNILKVI